MHYRWKTGMLAWVLFRVTGLLLVLYLSMHIIVISNLHDRSTFDKTMDFLGSWQFRLLEIGLFAVVLYHSLNGIRIFIIDFFDGSVSQSKIFWSLAGVGVVLFALGAYPMLSHALYWKDQQNKPTYHAVMTGSGSGSCPSCKGEMPGVKDPSGCTMNDPSCSHAQVAAVGDASCEKEVSYD
jgi:succinate dehydrogenase / fumarate reductase cytochrome b subunit